MTPNGTNILLDPAVNFGFVQASTGYDAAATSIVLVTGQGSRLPNPATYGPYNLTWWDSSNYSNPSDDPNKEIVRVTALSTDTITVTRAQEGTSASTKNTVAATYKLSLGPTKRLRDTLEEWMLSPHTLPIHGTPSTGFVYSTYTDDILYSVKRNSTTSFQLYGHLGGGMSGSGGGGTVFRSGVEQFMNNLVGIDATATGVNTVIIQGGYIYLVLDTAGAKTAWRCATTSDITTVGNWTQLTISGTALASGFIGYGDGQFWTASGAAYTPYTLSGTTMTSGSNITVTGAAYDVNFARVNDNGIYADFVAAPRVRFASFAGTLDATKQIDYNTSSVVAPFCTRYAYYVASNNTDSAGGVGRNVYFKIHF